MVIQPGDIRHRELSYRVIGCAIDVHRALGPGLDELFYHNGLCCALASAGIPHLYKKRVPLIHRGRVADEFEPDLVVDGKLIVELKALLGPFAPAHLAQTMCYLKFWRMDLGILVDFGKERVVQKRILFAPDAEPVDVRRVLAEQAGEAGPCGLLGELAEALHVVYSEHGLGYRDTTYRGLMQAELSAREIEWRVKPEADVRWATNLLGTGELDCMVVANEAALRVTALHQGLRAVDRAVLQSYLRHLGLRWGLAVDFGKQHLAVEYVSV